MPTPRVIDLSHHNTIPEDLLAAADAGIVGCIHKLTEGLAYVDDKVQSRHYLARQAGMKWGLYHFLRPGGCGDQAEYFVEQAYALGVIDADTVLVADHEDEGVSGEELRIFLDIVEDLTKRSPVIYSGHVLKEQLEGSGYRPRRRLWLCQYASEPILPEGIDQFWLWQYTDQGSIAGVNSPVDLNDIGDQDLNQFLAQWSGAHDAPPTQKVPVLTLSSDMPVRIHLGPNVEVV